MKRGDESAIANANIKRYGIKSNMRDLGLGAMRLCFRALLLYLGVVTVAYGQTQKRQLTLEWIFGPEGRSVASLPPTTWLDDGTLIMLDNRRPASERT